MNTSAPSGSVAYVVMRPSEFAFASCRLGTRFGSEASREGVHNSEKHSIANETAPSYKAFDEAYRKAMGGQPGQSNVYAAMTWDMVHVLALAIEAAGSVESSAINAKIREVANPPGAQVYSYAEGKAALKSGKINYEGASSVLDFDQYGDVTPDFGVFFIETGKLERKYVVKI